jgi:hypothetical protein
VDSAAERHDQAAAAHAEAAERHRRAAEHWTARGDPERAELERRNLHIELEAFALERDRATLVRRRVLDTTTLG